MADKGMGGPDASPVPRRRRILSPLTRRILAVNVLALAIPVAGLLYLGTYRDRLINAELDSLKTQTDIFAGALGEGATHIDPTGRQVLDPIQARDMIRRLTSARNVRARLFMTDGQLVADSRRLGGRGRLVRIRSLPPPPEDTPIGERALQVFERLFDALQTRTDLDTYREAPQQSIADYPEAGRALDGESVGIARQDGEGGFVLSVAMPVQRYRQVIGVVLLSRAGPEIQQSVRAVRIVVLQVFAGALVITVLLSLYLAGTIARPVHRLAEAAIRVRHGLGGPDVEIPDMARRGDEIGDLSVALRDMTEALYKRMDAIGRFAADVSHEIKNPLTSLRSAVETAARLKDPVQQQKLMAIILDDVQRLDRLITDISDYSRLDAELGRENREPVDIGRMLQALVNIRETVGGDGAPAYTLETPEGGDMMVPGVESRLAQVFSNLIDNARSFSPPDGTIAIRVTRQGGAIKATVSDDGPGMPDGKLEAVFDRFYSERPAAEKFGTHSGLGLSISRQIVEAHGGTIRAENRRNADGEIIGAQFTVSLPVD
ncbi:MAG: stimulus-sensing domain-containing protein [Proteobacteria bacterium]|nr:stimulus-sensing domain-containing protein [Pseudomonadota bacterium]